jgi:hypothetical protein
MLTSLVCFKYTVGSSLAPPPPTLETEPKYMSGPVSPPQRPPPLSDQSIDDWQNQITEDFNFIYDTLQQKQDLIDLKKSKKSNLKSETKVLEVSVTDRKPLEPQSYSDEPEQEPIDISIEIPESGKGIKRLIDTTTL